MIDRPTTHVIWDLLSSDSTRQGPFPVVREFSQFFLLLVNKAEQECKLPHQVPIDVRCQIDPQYRQIFQQLRRPHFFKTNLQLAQYIDRIHSPFTMAMTLITMLEIIIVDSSPLAASDVLRAIIVQRGSLDFLTNVKEAQLANLIATYVRRMRHICFPSNSRS